MVYSFGDRELDSARRELRRAGGRVHVEPQVFAVLRYLLENHERTVSRDDLVEHVWDGRFITDTTISARIAAARRAVGDSVEAQQVIRTVRGFGFRLAHR